MLAAASENESRAETGRTKLAPILQQRDIKFIYVLADCILKT
jgi:hypothetical protein